MGTFEGANPTAPGGRIPSAVAPENLAVIYQEALTAITRLRSGRQVVTDAAAFREQIKGVLNEAEAEAARKGYASDDVRLATFAVVAFLDESILNSDQPVFADWPRRPLQEELFGGHNAGEVFFQGIDRLMARPDSLATADVLEVFAFCLLLGFRGRYSFGGAEGTRAVLSMITDKLERSRGGPQPLSPDWPPPQDQVVFDARDPLLRGLVIGALAALLIAVLFFGGFKIALVSGASGIRSMAPVTSH